MRYRLALLFCLLTVWTVPSAADEPVRVTYLTRLVELGLIRSSQLDDPRKLTAAIENLRAWIGSAAEGPLTFDEKAMLIERPADVTAQRQALTGQLQASGFKRKLVASSALDSTIEHATLDVLQNAVRRYRRALGSSSNGAIEGAELDALNRDEEAIDTLARFETRDYGGRDLRINLPTGLVTTDEKDDSDLSWTTYSSPDDRIRVDYFINRGNSNTAVSMAATLLERRKGLYFNALDIVGDRFLIEASAQLADGSRELVVYHGRERNGGVQGLGLRTKTEPPAGVVVPTLQMFSLATAVMSPKSLPPESPEQARWRIVAKVISNLLASDFQRLNGSRFISMQDCKGVKRQTGGVRKSVNIVYATARKAGVAMSDFMASPLEKLYTSDQGSEMQVGCIRVSIPNSDAVMASQELPASRSVSEKTEVKKQNSEEFEITIPREPEILPLAGKDKLHFRSDEHLAYDGNERALLFIHGYNNSFEDAIKRAAQIAAASDYPGYIYVFSWPSQGRYQSYAADMDYAEQGEVDLVAFMKMILSTGVATKLDIVAHSMGSQILLRSLDGIKAMFDSRVGISQQDRVRLGQVIFAAPDVSTIVFKRKAAQLVTFSERTTVYASANDGALDFSGWLRGKIPRVGSIGNSLQPAIVPGVQMIDVTGTPIPRYLVKRYLNRSHNTFAYDTDVLDDIRLILTQSASSGYRTRWDPVKRSSKSSWPSRFESKLFKDKDGKTTDKDGKPLGKYWVLQIRDDAKIAKSSAQPAAKP